MIYWNDILKYAKKGNLDPDQRVIKSEEEWETLLSPEEYRVTRLKGTDPVFNSGMCTAFDEGIYECVCCNTNLFDSTVKYDSQSGWPAFTAPIKLNAIAYHDDESHGMIRIEVTCNTCESHLGHVFPDGPEPSGLRYCVNSTSLRKVK